MARLLVDEDFPRPAAVALRELDHDVATVQDLGYAGLPDRAILELASTLGRAIVSHNRKDFRLLHRLTNGKHEGIVVCTRDLDFQALATRISAALGPETQLAGRLLQVQRS